jgi:hypothetical protein
MYKPSPNHVSRWRYFRASKRPGSDISSSICLHQIYSKEELLAALVRALLQHEALRTSFKQTRGSIVQILGDPHYVAHRSLHYSDQAMTLGQVGENLSSIRERGFNYSQGPLFALLVGRIDGVGQTVSLVVDHIIADGISVDLFWETFLPALFDREHKESPAPVEHTYGHYCEQLARSAGTLVVKQRKYWKTVLQEPLSPIPFGQHNARPLIFTHSTTDAHVQLSEDQSAALRQAVRRGRVTLFSALSAALAHVVYSQFRIQDVLISSHISHRPRGFERTFGNFLNPALIRARALESISESAKKIMMQVGAIFDLAPILSGPVAYLNRPVSPSYGQLAQIFYVHLNYRSAGWDQGMSEHCSYVSLPSGGSQKTYYDVYLSSYDDGRQISLHGLLNVGLFDDTEARTFVTNTLRMALSRFVESDPRSVG